MPRRLHRTIISAPFGNWFAFDKTTPTLGTYTAQHRAGPLKRLWRVLSTVRPHPSMRAWTNRLGLPNPGIDHFATQCRDMKVVLHQVMVSISGRRMADWRYLFDVLSSISSVRTVNVVELNVSCPNCPGEPDTSNYAEVFRLAVEQYKLPVSVKLPPVGYEELAITALRHNVDFLHCCNTLPTSAGGLSGKPLQLLSLAACRFCRRMITSDMKTKIIGGGGVTGIADAQRFWEAGARHISVASALFNPFNWNSIRQMATRINGWED
jgi:dihydroorotate dehydrogenase